MVRLCFALLLLHKEQDGIHMPYKRKKDGTANRFRVCCAVFQLLIFAVPFGDTFGTFDASLDIRENQHDVVQLIG